MKNFISTMLFEIADEIDITKVQREQIETEYESVGKWLNSENGMLDMKYDVDIYAQGSMRLGTVIKPIGKDDYDVDLVCCLTKNINGMTSQQLKKLVGVRLSQNPQYKAQESKRCWTIPYSDKVNFHMDVLPAIPITQDDILREQNKQLVYGNDFNAIKITHKLGENNYEYHYSNPKGYANWFFSKMETYHRKLFESRAIEQIPQYIEKTPLQMAVQLLKRHRDNMFATDFNVRSNGLEPISIIITTLSAHAYNHEIELSDCLTSILSNFTRKILIDNGEIKIINPVMAHENFADKWSPMKKNGEAKRQTFYNWYNKAKKDFMELFTLQDVDTIIKKLKEMFTDSTVDKVIRKNGTTATIKESLNEQQKLATTALIDLKGLKHRVPAPWKSPLGARAFIRAEVQYGNQMYEYRSNGSSLDKDLNINFYPIIPASIGKNYTKVKWQITNTGWEAEYKDGLRGDKFEDSDIGNDGKHEVTAYTGSHIVQCFVLNGNKCVAQSGEFIVNIR